MSSTFPKRKYLPHFAPVERHNTPIVLFVTLTVWPRGDALANDAFHDAFLRALPEAGAWRVFLYVIMPDHVHLFVVPQTMPPFPIGKWVEFLKRKITQALHGHPQWSWQWGCWDTQMRNREQYEEKASYVRMNPVRIGLCATPDDWKWRGEGEWVPW